MKNLPLLTLSLGLLTFVGAAKAVDLVPFNAEWSYMHPLDFTDPAIADTDFDTTWFADTADFNTNYDGPAFGDPGAASAVLDSGIGNAPIGYGTINYIRDEFGGFATELTTPEIDERATAYFRHEFTTATDVANLAIDLIADDGTVIYLDGVELLRLNFTGADTYLANTTVGGNEDNLTTRSFQVGSLAAGDHILALSLHQGSPTSSDIGLALRLSDEGLPFPPAGTTDLDGTQNIFFLDGSLNDWNFDEADAQYELNNGNGGTIMSESVDLTGQTGVVFSMDLTLFERSANTNFEDVDSISPYLELTDLTGTTRIGLAPFGYDTNKDGAITGDEIFPDIDPGVGIDLQHVVTAQIPPGTLSARVMIDAVNDSGSEIFYLSDTLFTDTPPTTVIGTNNFSLTANDGLQLIVGPHAWEETSEKVFRIGDSDGGGRVLATYPFDLSSSPAASVSLELLAEAAGNTSGFESVDRFSAWAEVLDDAGNPSVIYLIDGGADANGDHVLAGDELTIGDVFPTSRTFTLAANLPENAATVQIFIAGDTDGSNEFLTFSNLVVGEAIPEAASFTITAIIPAAGTSYDIEFDSDPGTSYNLQFSSDLSSGSFANVGVPIVGGAGDTTTTNHDPGAITEGFYRISTGGGVVVAP